MTGPVQCKLQLRDDVQCEQRRLARRRIPLLKVSKATLSGIVWVARSRSKGSLVVVTVGSVQRRRSSAISSCGMTFIHAETALSWSSMLPVLLLVSTSGLVITLPSNFCSDPPRLYPVCLTLPISHLSPRSRWLS